MAESKNAVLCGGVIVAGVLAGIIALICSSYSDLHYYEVQCSKFKRNGERLIDAAIRPGKSVSVKGKRG